MTHERAQIERALRLCNRINAMSYAAEVEERRQNRLIVSFDVYCMLLEYTVYSQTLDGPGRRSLEDYLRSDDLVYDSGKHLLHVRIDFFLPPDSIRIQ